MAFFLMHALIIQKINNQWEMFTYFYTLSQRRATRGREKDRVSFFLHVLVHYRNDNFTKHSLINIHCLIAHALIYRLLDSYCKIKGMPRSLLYGQQATSQ